MAVVEEFGWEVVVGCWSGEASLTRPITIAITVLVEIVLILLLTSRATAVAGGGVGVVAGF